MPQNSSRARIILQSKRFSFPVFKDSPTSRWKYHVQLERRKSFTGLSPLSIFSSMLMYVYCEMASICPQEPKGALVMTHLRYCAMSTPEVIMTFN